MSRRPLQVGPSLSLSSSLRSTCSWTAVSSSTYQRSSSPRSSGCAFKWSKREYTPLLSLSRRALTALSYSSHWYYEDFLREEDHSLPAMTLKKFSSSLFAVCPFLRNSGHTHEEAFQSFLAYKTRVPVCGAIMLNETWDKVSSLSMTIHLFA